MLDLTLHIDRIPPEGHRVQGSLSGAQLQEQIDQHGPTGFRAQDPAELCLQVLRIDEAIQLKGHLSCRLGHSCVRCLAESSSPIKLDLDMTLFKAGNDPSDPNLDLEMDEQSLALDGPGTATYRGEQIDLGDLLREQLLLELPMSPLCSDDCAGLCELCGANLNRGPCDCVHDTIDLRWQALKHIKICQ